MDKYLKHILAILAGFVCMVIYIITLHPAVGFIDSGELAAVCYTFGVPHPTGYPLFLLLGYLVSHLPLPGTVIYRLNLLSAAESMAAVITAYYSVLILTDYVFRNLSSQKTKKPQSKKPGKTESRSADDKPSNKTPDLSTLMYFTAFFTAVCMGLTKTFWFDATQIEVYALHSFFISLLVYYSLKILAGIKEPYSKNWIMLFLILGLSAANHSTTVYFIPAVIYLYYLQYKNNKIYAKKLIPYGFLILPGLLLYGVLIISSSASPYLNWSDVQNISNLPGHLRGSDFSQLMFQSSAKFSENASGFFKELPGEFAYISLLFSAAGFLLLWKTFRNFVYYCLICFIVTLLYSFNYNTIEINSFYLLVFYLLSLSVSAGLIYIVTFGIPSSITASAKEAKSSAVKIIIAGLIITIFSAAYNFSENDNSGNYSNADYTINALNSVENNSVLLSYEYAYLYSASLYYQLAEKQRPDVKVFIIRFLAAPWYLKTISRYYPDLFEFIRPEAEDYIRSYENSDKTVPQKLTVLVKTFIEKCAQNFPLYITVDMLIAKEMKQFFTEFNMKPAGLLYKAEPKNAPYDPNAGVNTLNYNYRKIVPNSKHKSTLSKLIPGMYFETAYYHYNNKNFELSLKFLDKVLEIDPSFRDALNLKSKIASERK